jgi:phage terminase large subunit-like protein
MHCSKNYTIQSTTKAKLKTLWDNLKGWNRERFLKRWFFWARGNQHAPVKDWLIWLILGGRGAGKTRTGAEWIAQQVKLGARHIALVGTSFAEAREVMLEGESGLLNIGHPSERPKLIASRRRLEWPNGAVGHLYSAHDPDGLRGGQFDAAWADEFCAWAYPDETLSNLRLALRLTPQSGEKPRLVITTTPRPSPSLLALKSAKGVSTSHIRTRENARHLAPGFLDAMEDSYGGSPLGQQELEGEILTDFPGALWKLSTIAKQRQTETPALERIVVAIDPPATSGPHADACGLIVAGVAKGNAYVLEDATLHNAPPETWAEKVVALFQSYQADCVIAEGNQGGEMVEAVLRQVDPNLPIRRVHARRSKQTRAEPIAHLYTLGRVFHVGRFDALEAQMCQMGSSLGGGSRASPDRVDALVWAVHALLKKGRDDPRVRRI